MNEALIVICLTLIGGISIPLGGIIASVLSEKQKWHREEIFHGIIAFGGGALISAVCLVLVL